MGDNKGINKGAQNELIEAHFTKLNDTTHEEDVAYVNYSLDKKQPLYRAEKKRCKEKSKHTSNRSWKSLP